MLNLLKLQPFSLNPVQQAVWKNNCRLQQQQIIFSRKMEKAVQGQRTFPTCQQASARQETIFLLLKYEHSFLKAQRHQIPDQRSSLLQ